MIEKVACPDCGAQLELPALPRGQWVKCPRCDCAFEPARMLEAWDAAPALPTTVVQPLPVPEVRGPEDVSLKSLFGPPERLEGLWKAPAAMIALAVFFIAGLAQVQVYYQLYTLIQREQLAPLFALFDDEWHQWHERRRTADALTFWTFLPTALLFLIWLNQASRNAWRLRAEGLQFHPSAALSFLLPLANLVWPYCMVQEIWRASHPGATRDPRSWKETPASLPIRLWWACFLGTLVLGVLYVRAGGEFGDGQGALLACLGGVAVVVGVGLMIYIIHAIRIRQNARYERILVEWREASEAS